MKSAKPVLLSLLLPMALPAHALTVKCVSTSQGLRDALAVTVNNEDVEIRMKPGIYATGGAAFPVSLAADKHFKLSGGWTSDLCEVQLQDAALTVLDAGNTGYVVHLSMFNNSTAPTAELSNFTVANGNGNAALAGGMYVHLPLGSAQVLLDRLRLLDNDNSGPGGGLLIRNLADGLVVLRNSLITGNSATDGAGVIVVSRDAGAITQLLNNTIAGNHATSQNAAAGGFSIGFSDPSVGTVELRNNAIVGNTRGAIVSAAEAYAYPSSAGFASINNAYAVAPAGNVTATGSLVGPPGFVGNGNFRLAEASPLIDAGAELAPDDASSHDLDYRPRIAGSAVDIGAYEFDNVVFADGFE